MNSWESMRNRGGWPLSLFLTAEAKPIAGGTYWPREDRTIEGEKYRGFKSILQIMADANSNSKENKFLHKQGDDVAARTVAALERLHLGIPLGKPDRALLQKAEASL